MDAERVWPKRKSTILKTSDKMTMYAPTDIKNLPGLIIFNACNATN